jgi:hypothetical protein
VQLLQLPAPSHVPPVHPVPDPEKPPSTQTGAPVPHEIEPVRHSMPGSHGMPGKHGTHEPLPLQTPPVQAVPGGALLATHCGIPVVH